MFVFNNWQQFLTLIVNIDPSVKKENMLPTLWPHNSWILLIFQESKQNFLIWLEPFEKW